jgi:hypothetical protein
MINMGVMTIEVEAKQGVIKFEISSNFNTFLICEVVLGYVHMN